MKKIIALLILSAMMLTACSDSPGRIRDIVQSPTGDYQVDVVDWSGGATAGETYLCVEYAENGFANVGDDEPDSCTMIEDTQCTFNTDFNIEWETNDSFRAVWEGLTHDSIELARVELYDGGFNVTSGSVCIDTTGSYLSGFTVDGDYVYITCKLRVTNDFDEDVWFTIDAVAAEADVGELLSDSHLDAVNDRGESKVFYLEAGQTEFITVTFRGSHGPSDTMSDRELPTWIYIYYERGW